MEFNGQELIFKSAAGLKIAAKKWGFNDGFKVLALHG